MTDPRSRPLDPQTWVKEVQAELGVDEGTALKSARAALHALARLLPWDARCTLEKHLPESMREIVEGEKTAHDVEDLYEKAAAWAPEGR